MKDTWMKKGLVVSVILLFIGVAIAPTINFSVVKASNDNDLVEVTTQACGIKGFGNTTVKLTREQYNDLEQYLVDFRARLNQTTTREEAIPIFKEAVVELNKYGLLPKGMSVERAQNLVTRTYLNNKIIKFQEKLLQNHLLDLGNNSNFLCLIAGKASNCWVAGPIMTGLASICYIFYALIYLLTGFDSIFDAIVVLFSLIFIYQNFVDGRINFFSLLTFGSKYSYEYEYVVPAVGSIYTAGLLGIKNYNGSFFGKIHYPVITLFNICYTGAFGFTGIKILFPDYSSQFLGTALRVNIDDTPPS